MYTYSYNTSKIAHMNKTIFDKIFSGTALAGQNDMIGVIMEYHLDQVMEYNFRIHKLKSSKMFRELMLITGDIREDSMDYGADEWRFFADAETGTWRILDDPSEVRTIDTLYDATNRRYNRVVDKRIEIEVRICRVYNHTDGTAEGVDPYDLQYDAIIQVQTMDDGEPLMEPLIYIYPESSLVELVNSIFKQLNGPQCKAKKCLAAIEDKIANGETITRQIYGEDIVLVSVDLDLF